MFCKICGKEINDNAVICPGCGCATNTVEEKNVSGKKKPNILCILGFVLSLVSFFLALYGTVAIAGLILSIIGIVQAKKKEQSLKGLGIAGIVISAVSMLYTVWVLVVAATILGIVL